MSKKSPFAPAKFPPLPPLTGVGLATGNCGLRYEGRDDLLLVELAPATTVAGVFTRSQTASAPVEWCRAALEGGRARALVVNSGNANAFVGRVGDRAVKKTVAAAARLARCRPGEIFVASTGVIGQPLDADKIVAVLPALKKGLAAAAWEAAARAIMTTDTFAKGSTATTEIDGVPVTINGIVKGSGMIAPNMATMLAFVFTDATIPAGVLQRLLERAADRSFHCTTVDGDTSTSDTVLLCATGQARHGAVTTPGGRRLGAFRDALDRVMIDLAQQVVRDGEGASKFITIKVGGAASARAARRIGLTIANSPLVKTAIAGEDANWGRIVMAVGNAGERVERDRISVSVGGVAVARRGGAVPNFDETPVARHMKGRMVDIAVDVGVGHGKATVWTCDLTHGYIDINAHYRS